MTVILEKKIYWWGLLLSVGGVLCAVFMPDIGQGNAAVGGFLSGALFWAFIVSVRDKRITDLTWRSKFRAPRDARF